ncbi:hypothetical protein QNI19_28965 [Cytophagaceae bacterium DM2B3-1]|uniref:Uncharacterized protein n=1 Tax=Xanthocytophaga flava TaxID=3048013 RepID=A0ABT7CTE3_9BACT|nr:hypothetical protein [Xanthocytophaga flavus]MDJ1497003.1 hypothetical protein [Xanthocytophaga flavus]
MRKIRIVLFHSFLFVLFTILTQIGGIVWLICIPLLNYIKKYVLHKIQRWIAYLLGPLLIYLIVTFSLIPLLASLWGRVPLPINHGSLRPLTLMTVLLNRHYVRKELRNVVLETSEQMTAKFPGTVVHYLDAGFPFIHGFPLLPHLSHNDGEKLDLAFFYTDVLTKQPVNDSPSPIGYGICEEPTSNEENTAAYCTSKGYRQYSLLQRVMPQGNKKNYLFDSRRTKAIILLLVQNRRIGKLFIEPHLKKRMNLMKYDKIRFHGCQAVRHDDHIHIQLP